MAARKAIDIRYAQASEDTGVHHFRPVANSIVVNNRVIGRTLCKKARWKSVGKGYTFGTWTSLGRWLMAAFANRDYNTLAKHINPTVILPLKDNTTALAWKVVTGSFMPSRNITRVAIVYPYLGKTQLIGYGDSLVTVCREFDMYTSDR